MVRFTTAKSRPFPSRHILLACFVLLLCAVGFYNQPHRNPFRHFTHFDINSLLRKPRNGTHVPPGAARESWGRPAALSEQIRYVRGSESGNKLAKQSWTRPTVLTTYARPLDSDNTQTEVFVYVSGVRMGKWERNITVVGCYVGGDVYKAYDAKGEVFVCSVGRAVKTGEWVSLVVRKDRMLRRAMEGVMMGRVNLTIAESDLRDLPEGTRMHLPKAGAVAVDELCTIRSNSRIEGVAAGLEEIRKKARYTVCMGTQMKTFPHLLGDWVRYHRRLGVDMMYILDNDAAENLEEYVEGVSGVEVVYWPFEKSQTQAMSYLLVAARERCEWVLLSDSDEYVMIGVDENGGAGGVREYLERVDREVQQVYLPYLTMGVSGHVTMPSGAVAEEYLYKHDVQKVNGKVMARTDVAWLCSRIHVNRGRTEKKEEKRAKRLGVRNEKPKVGDAAVLVHFQKRSFEEVLIKRDTGSGSVYDEQIGGEEGSRWTRNAPNYYRRVKEELRYTYFRDVWRAVVEQPETMTLVKVVGHNGERQQQQVLLG